MRRKPRAAPLELTREVVVQELRGLSTEPARTLSAVAARFNAISTIETAAGRVADAKDLLQLLLLGVAAGDTITVRCSGPERAAALEAIATLLVEGSEGLP